MEVKNEKLVRMVNISKYFGEVAALKEENFEVGYNEVVGLTGIITSRKKYSFSK